MPYTTIDKSTLYFNTKLYTGTGSSNAVTGVGFQPDMVWGKNRDTTFNHQINDAVRGVNKQLAPNNGNAQETNSGELTAFGTDGFTVGTGGTLNGNGNDIVTWNWRAGAGAGSSNTDGSINTTSTSVNTTAGFSISTYTGTGSAATIGHGLGATPGWIIVKRLDDSSTWRIFHKDLGATKNLSFDTGTPLTQSVVWNDAAPTSSLFSVGTAGDTNGSSNTYVAYCWAEKTGYSKFSSYTGNGSADGTFVYTGFRPAFLLSKNTTATQGWLLVDSKRGNPFNPIDGSLHPNSNAAEDTSSDFFVDFYSNGFKVRDTDAQLNASGNIYVYIAFAEAPLVGSNNILATAR
tara:strand:- start:32 stop:1072 length:1041 start_codon:yes stop_codon:yes gene_type:complete